MTNVNGGICDNKIAGFTKLYTIHGIQYLVYTWENSTQNIVYSAWYINGTGHTLHMQSYGTCTVQGTCQPVYLPGQRVQPGPSRVSDSQLSAETVIYEAFVVMGKSKAFCNALLAWRKVKAQRSLEGQTHLPSQQRLHKLQFLQKQGCQKLYWDQARLPSLANKQVGYMLRGTHMVDARYRVHVTCYSPGTCTVQGTRYGVLTRYSARYRAHITWYSHDTLPWRRCPRTRRTSRSPWTTWSWRLQFWHDVCVASHYFGTTYFYFGTTLLWPYKLLATNHIIVPPIQCCITLLWQHIIVSSHNWTPHQCCTTLLWHHNIVTQWKRTPCYLIIIIIVAPLYCGTTILWPHIIVTRHYFSTPLL